MEKGAKLVFESLLSDELDKLFGVWKGGEIVWCGIFLKNSSAGVGCL